MGCSAFPFDVGEQELTAVIRAFRRNLETRTTYEYLTEGRQLYDWLVRPMESVLAQHGIDTLVFVPDGALRTIPLAALHDGEKFPDQPLRRRGDARRDAHGPAHGRAQVGANPVGRDFPIRCRVTSRSRLCPRNSKPSGNFRAALSSWTKSS